MDLAAVREDYEQTFWSLSYRERTTRINAYAFAFIRWYSCSNGNYWNLPSAGIMIFEKKRAVCAVINPFKIKEYHCQGLRRVKTDKHAVYIGAVFDADIIIFQIVTHHFSHCCFLWAVFSFCHKNTPKLSNSILHQFGGLRKL